MALRIEMNGYQPTPEEQVAVLALLERLGENNR
jgi:hypothetical protein